MNEASEVRRERVAVLFWEWQVGSRTPLEDSVSRRAALFLEAEGWSNVEFGGMQWEDHPSGRGRALHAYARATPPQGFEDFVWKLGGVTCLEYWSDEGLGARS